MIVCLGDICFLPLDALVLVLGMLYLLYCVLHSFQALLHIFLFDITPNKFSAISFAKI